MNGSGKAEMRQVSLAALPSISTTSFSASSTRGGPFSRSSFRDLPAAQVRAQSSHDTAPGGLQPCPSVQRPLPTPSAH
uniref:Uncharacterized protein n=1 Tax=Balaenoptera musculus TaxID=9771 RepID=A0A8C0C7L0_BALMU